MCQQMFRLSPLNLRVRGSSAGSDNLRPRHLAAGTLSVEGGLVGVTKGRVRSTACRHQLRRVSAVCRSVRSALLDCCSYLLTRRPISSLVAWLAQHSNGGGGSQHGR